MEDALEACASTDLRAADLAPTAGDDGLWLTEDDPWRRALLAGTR